jgi:uncharacterized protein HemX
MEPTNTNTGSMDSAEPEQQQDKISASAKSTSATATAFIFLALVISLAAGGVTFLLFQKLEQSRSEFSQQMENTRNNLSEVSVKLNGDVSGQLNTLSDKVGRMLMEQQQFQGQVSSQQRATSELANKLSLSNQQIRQSIDVLFRQKGRDRIGWILAEVEYMLLIANHSLKLQNEVHTAIAALEGADKRLLDTGDPGIIEIRKDIRDEIQSLKNLQQPDLVGMAATLSSLIKTVQTLPIKFTQVNTKKKIDDLIEKKGAHDAETLSQASKDFLRELRGLVVIRKMNETPKPLMSPEHQFFLQQNLQLKLETARRALLMGQQQLYKNSLNEAIQWLQEYFDGEAAGVNQTIQELKALETMTISSELPDISGSIKVLRAYQRAIEKQKEGEQ